MSTHLTIAISRPPPKHETTPATMTASLQSSSVPAQVSDQSSSPFFNKLPAEVRLVIYEFALPTILNYHSNFAFLKSVPLVHTCRRLRAEIPPVLYRTTVIGLIMHETSTFTPEDLEVHSIENLELYIDGMRGFFEKHRLDTILTHFHNIKKIIFDDRNKLHIQMDATELVAKARPLIVQHPPDLAMRRFPVPLAEVDRMGSFKSAISRLATTSSLVWSDDEKEEELPVSDLREACGGRFAQQTHVQWRRRGRVDPWYRR